LVDSFISHKLDVNAVTMRFKNVGASTTLGIVVPMMFLDHHLLDAARMTSHETTKNALRPKNHPGFEHARAEYDRRPIITDWRLTRRNRAPIPYQTEYSGRHGSADRQADHHRKSPNGENYKKYEVFKITTKAVEVTRGRLSLPK